MAASFCGALSPVTLTLSPTGPAVGTSTGRRPRKASATRGGPKMTGPEKNLPGVVPCCASTSLATQARARTTMSATAADIHVKRRTEPSRVSGQVNETSTCTAASIYRSPAATLDTSRKARSRKRYTPMYPQSTRKTSITELKVDSPRKTSITNLKGDSPKTRADRCRDGSALQRCGSSARTAGGDRDSQRHAARAP